MSTVTPADLFFHRPELAKALADQALDVSLGTSGGMFLAAPRRTGKSTFVRQDLVPELEQRGVHVIYVDLWIDKSVDPAIHIANAVREALAAADGAVMKMFKVAAGMTSFNVGAMGSGLSFDLSQLGLAKESTLADALKTLSKALKCKLVLVIDEAQHALTTDGGMNALFSLKAARDSLNTDAGLHGMQLIATGSNRDKLATLVNGREQAFYGADMVSFPSLGKDYLAWAIQRSGLVVDEEVAFETFTKLGYRPEPFRKALTETRLALAVNPVLDGTQVLAEKAATGTLLAKTDFLNTVANLPPLQSALLRELSVDARRAPGSRRDGVFSAPMKKRLQERLQADMGKDHGVSVEPSSIQNAMDSLREDNFLWRSQRGNYAIEDEQFADWLAEDEPETPEVDQSAEAPPQP